MLGFELKYRGGYSFAGEGRQDFDKPVKNSPERHQWLEVTFRPSNLSFSIDLWYEGVHQNNKFITLPISETYQKHVYPNGKLIIGTKL